ncbi:hypothetical protein KSF_088210 [Reticulibacter mediterranei]|uniref:Uncharacterized protein n=1 Tax=Reticulibacter mediterranei TaxID=2778369 RepID=A0A8J3IUG8_9CHLR|nr:hypothetical protein [Reticulibacter mediterranei]GHO98773.1 hypothetical protein KSF_088210 [Reticulibacter mediterranei]
MSEQPNPVKDSRAFSDANIALNVLAAFAIGGIISLFLSILLSILHRNITPALLAGLLGSIIYCVRVLPQWMPGRRSSAPAPQRKARVIPWTGSLNIRNQFIAIAILSLLVIALGGGLNLLPDQQLIFILLSAVLGLLLCVCLFVIGLLALGIFLARGDRHNVFIAVADDATEQGEEIDKGNS